MASILSVEEVKEFISDNPESNLLLDEDEFSYTFIMLCMDLAADSYNSLSPMTRFNVGNFPSKSLLLLGTLYHMFSGAMAKMARNQLSYTDGGLQIPVEEKYELYKNLADTYGLQFNTNASRLKTSMNMEAGWGEIRSDEATFPLW